MELNNAMNVDIEMEDDSPRLFYETSQKKEIQVSIVIDPNRNILNKHVIIKHPASSSSHAHTTYSTVASPYGNNMVINIQLLYDPNTPMEHNLWNGSFHPILLYGSMEYLALDTKNIKVHWISWPNTLLTNKSI